MAEWIRYNEGWVLGKRKTVSRRACAGVPSRSGRFQRRDAVKHLFRKRICEQMRKKKQHIKDYYSAVEDVLRNLSEEEIGKLDKYVQRMNDPDATWQFRPLSR